MKSPEAKPDFDALLVNYREACPQPEGTMGFVPNLWRRIESHRLFLRRAKGWTSAYVLTAAAVCLILVILLSLQAGPLHQAYVDILDDDSDTAAASIEASSVAASPDKNAPVKSASQERPEKK